MKNQLFGNKLCHIIFLFISIGYAQDQYQKQESVDIKGYIFNLTLNDESNEIKGETIINVDFKSSTQKFVLDLIGKSGDFGMSVSQVYEGDSITNYTHLNNKIVIPLSNNDTSSRTFKVVYKGVPRKGLVIDTTKFGRRSFFGDNWPNLARHWLPSIDHPYDKASIEFRVTAPEDYDVVATGKKIEESNLGNGIKITTYKENTPVAMKVVTIGVTKFASKLLDVVHDIPVTAWVYPENRLDGFSDYNVASKVLNYFIENIGPYPFAKLANMQAKTQWGGLENAGTIAYFEDSVTGKNTVEGLIAHEIAHQWFGNSATENNWNHVWLSEGFATYFSILYLEHIYGNEKRKDELALDRKQVIDYYKQNPSPIVDLTIEDPMKVLSPNSYQKGGWVLNMLRHELGDAVFWKGIRNYYKTYRDSNVMTKDFRQVMEEVSGKNLGQFFNQWLFTKGHPEIKWNWEYRKGDVIINLNQIQNHHVFQFPLEIGLLQDDELIVKKVNVESANEIFKFKTVEKPSSVLLDPNYWLLFEH
ncbi:M1 family metallopeptidase [Maribacter sp. HTCC2170]|uniref:M1 family metallopeptidase n=1 Tax=Maribacter sp. (strain HTCC2170 / KCCM 42371) TaxID=313603 RepID=UPI00006AE673|nr:M1 family metallopeptidase [Maribacter sp. HTCC2170]EAR00479.1 putative metallopeptidase [Maribacter sp. HTCC2170]